MLAASTTPTPIVDWTVLGKVLEYSLLIGIGLILVASISIVAFDRAKREGASLAVKSVGWVFTALTLLAISASIVWGFLVIVKKS